MLPIQAVPVQRTTSAATAINEFPALRGGVEPSVDWGCLAGCAASCGLSILPCIPTCIAGGVAACLACIGTKAPGCVSCVTKCF